MDQKLVEYCQSHFSKSHGTPFTIPPLSTLLKYDGLTPFGTEVLHGTADLDALNLDHSTRLLLQHQKYCTPPHAPQFQEMPYDGLMQGIQKWKERTTTSPSGRHLGIYKSLLKDEHKSKTKKNKPTPKKTIPEQLTRTPTDKQPPECNGADVMQIVHKLLVMAVRYCHTFERWTTIWNLFIEKDLGNPQLDRLRTLHIIKADYNLLLKWFAPQGVLKRAETHQQITDNQGGCRKGQSTIDLTCKKV